jgi:hypothetical protein
MIGDDHLTTCPTCQAVHSSVYTSCPVCGEPNEAGRERRRETRALAAAVIAGIAIGIPIGAFLAWVL